MGTRGAIGFFSGGVTKVTYNHYDSYPRHLGDAMARWGAKQNLDELRALFPLIRLVSDHGDMETKPTLEDQLKCFDAGWYDQKVGNQTPEDWYNLLRNVQGQLEYLKAFPTMINSEAFLSDSLFCEYAYIFNLDTGKLEVYEGFQTAKGKGRYTGTDADYANWKPHYPDDQCYWGVSLISQLKVSPTLGTRFTQWLRRYEAKQAQE